MASDINKNIIYYGVYDTEREALDKNDILCAVRKRFFSTGSKQTGRGNIKTEEGLYNYSYVMEYGVSLRYRKLKPNGQQLERVFDIAGGYFVETLDQEHRAVKKAFFDSRHNWKKTQFLSYDNNGNYEIYPSKDGNKPVLILKSAEETQKLYAFDILIEDSMMDDLNRVAGKPKILCSTNFGKLYFCTYEECNRRKEILKNLSVSSGDEMYINTEVYADIPEEEPIEAIKEIFTADKENTEENILPVIEEAETENNVSELFEKETAEKEIIKEVAVIEESDTKDIRFEQCSDVPCERKCGFVGECPYEVVDKQIIDAMGKRYVYFGEIADDKRNGSGRTIAKNGTTAYEGQYISGMRDGLGAFYYTSGKLCYAGNWKKNKKNGFGVMFSRDNETVFAGEWNDDKQVNTGVLFDSKGKMLYCGGMVNGVKQGIGMTYSENSGNYFVGKYKDGEFLFSGTEFDSSGILLYTGDCRNDMRNGSGISYNPDGSLRYRGEWSDNLYNGKGTLYLEDGGIFEGQFQKGQASGNGVLMDKNGRMIYQGNFFDGMYNGTGRMFLDNGGYAEGEFKDGEPVGIFREYDSNEEIVYVGEWFDMHRNGRGEEYRNGEKIYEGDFVNSLYNGQGKEFLNGKEIYQGSFAAGVRDGYGTEMKEDRIYYRGMWRNGLYDGSGMMFENGELKYTGMFKNGMKHGRVNELSGNRVIRESVYENDVLVYMKEYYPNGTLAYYGSVIDGVKNGMGCEFAESFEKNFEGIFKNGIGEKPMKVILKKLDKIPPCEALKGSEYDKYRIMPETAVDMEISVEGAKGIYTGRLKDDVPEGNGTVLYSDHRYTGEFFNGKPKGRGIIYMSDGSEKKGVFSTEKFQNSTEIKFSEIKYYYKEVR